MNGKKGTDVVCAAIWICHQYQNTNTKI